MKTLAIGAVSKEAIEATFKFSHTSHLSLILSVDKLQIDHSGGYVMKTSELNSYVKELRSIYLDSQVTLARKNCGPGFASTDFGDTWRTIETDCKNGFDMLHLDFTNLRLPRSEVHKKELSAFKHAKSLNSRMLFEIGHHNLRRPELQAELDYFCPTINPVYCNVYTGTEVKEGFQLGKLIDNIGYLHDTLRSNTMGLKESNADYLTAQEIQSRRGIVDCMEINSELSTYQNSVIITEADNTNICLEKIVKEAIKNKAWKKQLHLGSPDDEDLCIQLTLNQYLSTPEGHRIFDKVNVRDRIILGLCNILDRYAMNFLN